MLARSTFLLTFAAAISSGLVSGVFLGFSSFIMPAFARIAPGQGIAAMNSINITVINPLFMSLLFGTAVIGIVLSAGSIAHLGTQRNLFVLVASVLYVVGCAVVTIGCNVPLNNALAGVVEGSADALPLWTRFLKEWTFWNHVRTIASGGACAFYIAALVSR
jgi:uncharacterized membrane protein